MLEITENYKTKKVAEAISEYIVLLISNFERTNGF